MFLLTTEYALRAVVYLAKHAGTPVTTDKVAEGTNVPVGYMSKVMTTLARTQLVRSQRGPSGGFLLARTPDEITMLDVVEAVEPLPRIRECPLKLDAHETALCPLHRCLDELAQMAEDKLRATTIEDLLSSQIKPLGENGCPMVQLLDQDDPVKSGGRPRRIRPAEDG